MIVYKCLFFLMVYILIGVSNYYIFKLLQAEEKDKDFLVFISSMWPITLLTMILFFPVSLIMDKIKKIQRNLDKVMPPTEFCKTSNDY